MENQQMEAGSEISPQSDEEIDIDEALQRYGPFGKFQVLIQLFCMFAIFINAYQSIIIYFEGDNPPWTCAQQNTSQFCAQNFPRKIDVTNRNFTKRCELRRDEWKYTTDKKYSYVTEFDLVCERNALTATIGGIFFIGSALASVITGTASDLYGRKLVLSIALIVMTTCSIATSFITEIWHLLVLRVLIGASEGTGVGLSFIYLAEFITTGHRSLSGNICNVAFSFALFFLVTVAYHVQEWRKLQLYVSLPGLLAVGACFFLPKSPRWLLATGRATEAEEIIRKIAATNGKPCLSLKLKRLTKNLDENIALQKYTYLDFFRNFNIIKLILIQGLMWLTAGLMFFAVTLNSSNLGGDMYTSFIYVALPDLPCCLLSVYLCDRLGRKKTVLYGFGLAGVFIGGIAIVLLKVESSYTIAIILSMIGKCFLNIAFNAIYVWTFELFPTVLRTQGFSLCLIMSRIGGAAAPFLSDVLRAMSPAAPYELMAALGVISACLGSLLPETNKCSTREQYEDFFDKKTAVKKDENNVGESNDRNIVNDGYC